MLNLFKKTHLKAVQKQKRVKLAEKYMKIDISQVFCTLMKTLLPTRHQLVGVHDENQSVRTNSWGHVLTWHRWWYDGQDTASLR